MDTRVNPWGNSLGLRIPQALAREIGLEKGSKIKMTVEQGKLVIQPVRPVALQALVERITPENSYEAMDFGQAEGREVW